MKRTILILLAWLPLVVANAQTVSYPHEVFDPLGIPQVEGAKLLHVDKGTKPPYPYPIVVYGATVQQVMDWIAKMDNLGFVHLNREKETKKYISRGAAYKGARTIDYYFPVGSDGDKQSKFVRMQCRFDQDLTFRKGLKVPGATMVIQLTPFTHKKLELDYQKGVFNSIGITDESGFIPKHARRVLAQAAGRLQVEFVEGYIPTRADLDAWVNKLYKACAENASSIDPILQGKDLAKVNDPMMFTSCTHYWTYTYNGKKYRCSITPNFDMGGTFQLWIME